MKKILSLILIVIISLSACNSGEEASGELVVGIWGSPVEIESLQEQLDTYSAENGVEVTLKIYTDYTTELQTELIGGTAPDIFYVDAYQFPFLQDQGTLLPIDVSLLSTEGYDDNLLSAFTKEEELYALPKDYSTLALYYNKDYVDVESIPSSYEELEDYLVELQKDLPKDVSPWAYNIDLARQMYAAEIGGIDIVDDETGLANLTEEQTIENLSYEFNLAQEGLNKTPDQMGYSSTVEMFGSGGTAFTLEGSWLVGELNGNYPDLNYGTIENLSINGEVGTMMYTVGWGINSETENELGAYSLIEYLNSSDLQLERFESNGTIPPTSTVASTLDLDTDEFLGAHIAGASYATVWQAGNTLETINTEYQNYMPSVGNGKITLEEGLFTVEEEANKIIKGNE